MTLPLPTLMEWRVRLQVWVRLKATGPPWLIISMSYAIQSHCFYFFGPWTFSSKTIMDVMNVFFNPSDRTYYEEMIQTGILQLLSSIPLIEDKGFRFLLQLVFPIMKYLLRYVVSLVWSSDWSPENVLNKLDDWMQDSIKRIPL